MRKSTVLRQTDAEGAYEVEIFDHPSPKRVIVCSHGNGVRRWDGEKFFYAVAEHFDDCAVMLVDQNQIDGEGVRLNPLPTLQKRVEGLVQEAKRRYPGVQIILFGHSMGCGVAALMDADGIDEMIFVAPAARDPELSLIDRYGPEIANGLAATTGSGRLKVITPEYYQSVKGVSWIDAYRELLHNFPAVHVFESGDDEVIGEEWRSQLRPLPFSSYSIIKGAKHNFAGAPLVELFSKLDDLVY